MNKLLQLTPICILSFFLFSKCAEPMQVPTGRYTDDSRGKYLRGQLNDSSYGALKAYLLRFSMKELKDTIVIKYDFNSNECWGGLHDENDTAILNRIKRYQKGVAEQALLRPEISVFEFREAGNTIPKYRRWNDSVKIDNGFLQRLFFTERVICGTSVIILPDRQFLLIKTDPHFDALYYLSKKDMLVTIFPAKRNG